MDRASYFIDNKALFGSYPTQESVIELENMGVKYFLNLTRYGEKGIFPYRTKYHYENYPIYDRSFPYNKISFSKLIIKYSKIIKELRENDKVYIHCRGGHGRSGIVVACILTYLYKINPQQAMEKTSFYHSKRKIMSEKWRSIGSPQVRVQKNFVSTLFKPVYITKHYEDSLANIFDDIKFNDKPPSYSLENFNTDLSNKLPISQIGLLFQKLDEDYNTEKIFKLVFERIKKDKNIIIDLLNTGLGRIIFVSAQPKDRDKISNILNQIRTYFFSCIE
jgi:hypothetical protein